MGNTKSKRSKKEPDNFFDRQRWKQQKKKEKGKMNANPINKRIGMQQANTPAVPPEPPGQGPTPTAAQVRSYHDEALDRMRYQLQHDSDAFLLNNILLSVQFFENYEREMLHVKNNPTSDMQHLVDEAMVQHHKHVFFADRLHERVQNHVYYQRPTHSEPLTTQKLYVIYDNIEASDPSDMSDYSAVLDAPFYKLHMQDCKEPGYITLKKVEILERTLTEENETCDGDKNNSDDSVYADSETESNDDQDFPHHGEMLLQKLKNKIESNNFTELQQEQFRRKASLVNSGPTNKILDINNIYGDVSGKDMQQETDLDLGRPALKNARRLSGPTRDKTNIKQYKDIRTNLSESVILEDAENTSGYRSTSSSRQNESSETESDYGYSTITELATPKKVEVIIQRNSSVCSSVLPEDCWSPIQVQAIDYSDDEDDDESNSISKSSTERSLFETQHYLCSTSFMANFVENFMAKLGFSLGFTQETLNNVSTQGASLYCNTVKNGLTISYEIFPALLAAWPNIANEWIIRFRKPIENPRTKFKYQWPIKYMINKAVGIGCLLIPVGFRPKRGFNSDQKLQWKIVFPAAERYLESCLAHSHIRCYLFTLALHKTFIENETSKIGIDANHIKNHLFWQCEDNYAKWPEDRLGEALRLFLRTFYMHLGQGRLPNYFIDTCNDLKSIPKPLLLKQQRQLADILEAPVMHFLKALQKIKYHKREFYPTFDCNKLYEILTCKNPLRLLNPNLPAPVTNKQEWSDTEEEETAFSNIWDKTRNRDRHYQWKKEKLRQIQTRRKVAYVKKQKNAIKPEADINKNTILPPKMEAERRRLVLEFFIPHFIAMARSSEKFECIKQALIYLEQARRLCILLHEEPATAEVTNEYFDVIRDKLADCHRKLANQDGFILPPRRDSRTERYTRPSSIRFKKKPKYHHIINQDSPSADTADYNGVLFTLADVHIGNTEQQDSIKFTDSNHNDDSKL